LVGVSSSILKFFPWLFLLVGRTHIPAATKWAGKVPRQDLRKIKKGTSCYHTILARSLRTWFFYNQEY
jgi:hypothetical protein